MAAGSSPEGRLDAERSRRLDGVVDGLLATAEATDQADQLPDEHFGALADLGLYGMTVPVERGGLGLTPAELRGVLRRIGSGCGATAFAFAQHHGTVGALVATDDRAVSDRWLPGLSADVLAGIAYAHVRRSGPAVLRAEPVAGGGWVLDGAAPWVTSWGLADEFGVAARSDDGRLVWALVPAGEGPGLTMGKRFELSVFGATATVALEFDRFRVPPERLIDTVDFAAWAERDQHLAARPNPLCLGIGDRAMAMLADVAPDHATELAEGWADLGGRADAQSAAVDEGRSDLAAVATARAETVLGTQHLTAALLAAVGGRGMERGHPAQRLHREAGFYVVQALNGAGREAMLSAVAARV